jgi:hypothetical protein
LFADVANPAVVFPDDKRAGIGVARNTAREINEARREAQFCPHFSNFWHFSACGRGPVSDIFTFSRALALGVILVKVS